MVKRPENFEIHSKMIWPCNGKRYGYEGRTQQSQHTRLLEVARLKDKTTTHTGNGQNHGNKLDRCEQTTNLVINELAPAEAGL